MSKDDKPDSSAFEFRNCSCGKFDGHWPECPAWRPEEPPSTEIGFTDKPDTGYYIDAKRGAILPEADHLEWAIQGQAVMATSIPEQLQDGSYRIVLSSSENWVLKSVLMSGLDSSTEIELILAPRI